MRVSGLTSGGDWRFGRGKANYLQRSDAIRQNVVTRLRSFTDDWFANVDAGIPWIQVFGQRGNRDRISREIERTVLATEGVRAITRLRIVSVDQNRGARIELAFRDIFDENYSDTVVVP